MYLWLVSEATFKESGVIFIKTCQVSHLKLKINLKTVVIGTLFEEAIDVELTVSAE